MAKRASSLWVEPFPKKTRRRKKKAESTGQLGTNNHDVFDEDPNGRDTSTQNSPWPLHKVLTDDEGSSSSCLGRKNDNHHGTVPFWTPPTRHPSPNTPPKMVYKVFPKGCVRGEGFFAGVDVCFSREHFSGWFEENKGRTVILKKTRGQNRDPAQRGVQRKPDKTHLTLRLDPSRFQAMHLLLSESPPPPKKRENSHSLSTMPVYIDPGPIIGVRLLSLVICKGFSSKGWAYVYVLRGKLPIVPVCGTQLRAI